MSKRVARYGMFVALSFLFAYIETWIPFSLGIPGTKLGLANLITLTALYVMETQDAFWILLVRIVLVGFTFGNLSMMLYSLAGGLLSFFAMVFCKTRTKLSQTGVSLTGGITHNLGQLVVAMAVLQNEKLFYYFPFLMLFGGVSGAFIGILGSMVIKRLPKRAKRQPKGTLIGGTEEETGEKKATGRRNRLWRDVLLAGGCFFISGGIFLLYQCQESGNPREAVVYIGNEEYARYALNQPLQTVILGINGGTNELEIENGRVRVTAATCPDHICVQQGEISEIGQVIVCMPNQVIVAVEAAQGNSP